jgi:hypothetical protein
MNWTTLSRWYPNDRQVVKVDHQTITFTVSIRTMGEVSPETIKRMLQARYEVTECKETDRATIATPIGS